MTSALAFSFTVESHLETELSWIGLEEQDRWLRENRFGQEWQEGINVQTSLLSRFSFEEHLTLVVEPIIVTPRDGRDVYFRRAYVRGVLLNTALTVGRTPLWWGPGKHGSLLLSTNPFPFDLIGLGSDRPFSLPGILHPLGTFQIDSFFTRLEENRAVPHAKLFGLRFMYTPIRWLTLGFTRVIQFNGEGKPSLSLADFLQVYFGRPNDPDKSNVNELASLDARITLPFSLEGKPYRALLYGEYGGEDEASFFPTKSAILLGMTLAALHEGDPTWEVLVEYAQNHVQGFPNVWYNHSVYNSGYTYRGRIIGHHMGHDANDFFINFSFPLSLQDKGEFFFNRVLGDLSLPRPARMTRIGGGVKHHIPFLGPFLGSWLFLGGFIEALSPSDPQENRSQNYGVTLRFLYDF